VYRLSYDLANLVGFIASPYYAIIELLRLRTPFLVGVGISRILYPLATLASIVIIPLIPKRSARRRFSLDNLVIRPDYLYISVILRTFRCSSRRVSRARRIYRRISPIYHRSLRYLLLVYSLL
jgi:hypothetical protein